MKRAIFLDRDGTLIVEKNYLSNPAEVEFFAGVGPALKRLQDAGFLLFMVTNQSGIGRGYFTVQDMERVHARIQTELNGFGVHFERIYFAPEAPDQPSRGRKPSPQFLFDARDEFGIDLSQSYMVGDKLIDLECGWNAGVQRAILVRTGYGTEWEAKLGNKQAATTVVSTVAEAADWILGQPGRSVPPGRAVGIIPARFGSTRFPGKPLVAIAGKPLIQRVVEQCRKARNLADVIVATDDARIAKVASQFCRVEMTRPDHPSGTDRIAEVAARESCASVVNIQGDEPLLEPGVVDAVVEALRQFETSTAATPIRDPAEFENPNVVKVVVSRAGRALYFSRRTIPYLRDAANRSVDEQMAAFPFLKHLGLYGYRREALLRLVQLPVSSLEAAEKLEQLRALENGVEMGVVRVDYESVGVDIPEDVERVERMLAH